MFEGSAFKARRLGDQMYRRNTIKENEEIDIRRRHEAQRPYGTQLVYYTVTRERHLGYILNVFSTSFLIISSQFALRSMINSVLLTLVSSHHPPCESIAS